MKREIYSRLLAWKNSPVRKPLLLQGARQVGKTYILRAFGEEEYKHVAYINCDNNSQMRDVFFDYDIPRILRNIAAIVNLPILPQDTLIILDEIQEIPGGLASLKYFYENAPQYHIAVAGSLLGIALHADTSFPVGKIDMLDLYPMSFSEFLTAMNETSKLELLQKKDWTAISPLRASYIELLRQYYFVGGMPEAITTYIRTLDLQSVRKIQKEILSHYQNDFSKHAPLKEVPRIGMVWQSIPSQLAKENKKFIYGAIKKGARAVEFELAIQWLVDCGLVHKVSRVTKPSIPLKFYEDFSAFKLFMSDCGLMGAMSDTPLQEILVGSSIFEEYKGAFTEQFVFQQLQSGNDRPIYYYTNENSTLEIDFLIQNETEVLALEVKAEENLRAKSLRNFSDKFKHTQAIRISMSDYKQQDWMRNVPLYAINYII